MEDLPFIVLHKVDSTNNYAMGLVHEAMAQHGMAVFAKEQTRGRGQRNREWISEKDQNIALSLILHVNGSIPFSKMFLLSKAVAVGALHFFNSYVGEGSCIKWPNDLYWGDRKAGGILIENVLQGNEWKWAVAGIGINVNQVSFGGLSGRAVSLRQITGEELNPEQLARELRSSVLQQVELLAKDPSGIKELYDQHLYKKGRQVKLRKGNLVFDATIDSVTEYGQLVVNHAIEERFSVGEVEWLI